MSEEENVSIARRYLAEQDRLKGGLPEELLGPGYTVHLPGSPPMDRAGHEQMGRMFWAAFPDLAQTVEDAFGNDEKVVVRYTARGTHTGELMGMPPTGKQVAVAGISMFRIVDGKIEEANCLVDMMGMMQQLGAMPTPEHATT